MTLPKIGKLLMLCCFLCDSYYDNNKLSKPNNNKNHIKKYVFFNNLSRLYIEVLYRYNNRHCTDLVKDLANELFIKSKKLSFCLLIFLTHCYTVYGTGEQ